MSNKYTYQCVHKDIIRKDFEIHDCDNMKEDINNHSMRYECYKCNVCGKTSYLDYEEMK